MKDKQKKSLEDLDFLTELTPSEQEGINGGVNPTLTSYQEPIIVGGAASLSPTPYVPPEDDDNLYKQPLSLSPTPKIIG
ncbi:hypothetical protein [Scytonema sp. PCC 10023]|uniref:hypothetical protein n=1 Tax=Scytonema sp. PCC 10023 TaxID=1680591 RepID=UPI0039C75E0C